MPKNIHKSLQDYISKIKTPNSPIRLTSKKWNLTGCRHPRTPSLAIDNKNTNNKDDEATLADIDRFLFENFKSLFLEDKRIVSDDEESHEEKSPKPRPMFDSSPSNTLDEPSPSPSPSPSPLDLYGSNRFYVNRGFSGPAGDVEAGSSSASSTTATINDSSPKGVNCVDQVDVPDNCVVVLASSPSPYHDFRRSMEGMVEARLSNNETVDWDFMEELLFCFINLNEKKSFKFILSAFVDLVTVMRQNSEVIPPKPTSVRTIQIGREVRRKKKTKEPVSVKFA